MREATLRALLSICEGANLPPPPERRAKLRAEVQKDYEGLGRLMPQIQAKVSSLAPRLIGQDVGPGDAEEVDEYCAELADMARQLGTQADALRNSVKKLRSAKG